MKPSRPKTSFPCGILLLAIGTSFLSTACSIDIDSEPPQPLRIGMKVVAPWSTRTMRYRARVTELYGEMAGIRHEDGEENWVPVGSLFPKGLPSPDPIDQNEPSIAVGTRVLANWFEQTERLPGQVAEVYGKLAKVVLDRGEWKWYWSADLEVVNTPGFDNVDALGARGALDGIDGRDRPEGIDGRDSPSAQAPRVGARIKATTKKRGGKLPGRIAEVYGQLVYVYFENGRQIWVDTSRIDPPCSPGPAPSARGSALFRVGSTVSAPREKAGEKRQGVVVGVYGKLVSVALERSETLWFRGWELESVPSLDHRRDEGTPR